MLRVYNTLNRKKEVFQPKTDKKVGLYTCGPTVYSYAHIGNLRTYIFEDILKRVLLLDGYKVKHVMNITDVGHLTSDADAGEDKIEKAAKKEKKSAQTIAEFYAKAFFQDCQKLNIIPPDIKARATDHIKEDIALIKELEKKGFTYHTKDGIYFDTSKLKDYGKLTGMNFQKLNKTLRAGSRIKFSSEKRNITDFALWKFSPLKSKRQMEWSSPWGIGFPGWHIECSVINLKYLGNAFQNHSFRPQKTQTIDIHTGGIDHIPIHHTNEIAQVEAATGKRFVNYWLHGAFLTMKKGRMGKSEGNTILLKTIEEKKYNPLAFRYLILNTSYRSPLAFSWESLANAQSSLDNIYNFAWDCLWDKKHNTNKKNTAFPLNPLKKKFQKVLNDDLNTPQALAILWTLIKQYYQARKDQKEANKLSPLQVYNLLLEFDKVLGLEIEKLKLTPIPLSIEKLSQKREQLRQKQQWSQSDKIREQINQAGYIIKDTPWGTVIKPNTYGKQ